MYKGKSKEKLEGFWVWEVLFSIIHEKMSILTTHQ